jgi:proteasome lid subunit RPN8/RPN11
VILPSEIRTAIESHARSDFPNEACGLLATDGAGRIRMAYPLTNADRSAHRFRIDPDEHWGALRHAERNGWSIGGAFHSHPASDPVPSPTDVAGALDPDWIHVIVGPMDSGTPSIAAYRIVDGTTTAVSIEERG